LQLNVFVRLFFFHLLLLSFDPFRFLLMSDLLPTPQRRVQRRDHECAARTSVRRPPAAQWIFTPSRSPGLSSIVRPRAAVAGQPRWILAAAAHRDMDTPGSESPMSSDGEARSETQKSNIRTM
jgi:hypothetical protein